MKETINIPKTSHTLSPWRQKRAISRHTETQKYTFMTKREEWKFSLEETQPWKSTETGKPVQEVYYKTIEYKNLIDYALSFSYA